MSKTEEQDSHQSETLPIASKIQTVNSNEEFSLGTSSPESESRHTKPVLNLPIGDIGALIVDLSLYSDKIPNQPIMKFLRSFFVRSHDKNDRS